MKQRLLRNRWLLVQKITKRIHSSKPASLNRPIWQYSWCHVLSTSPTGPLAETSSVVRNMVWYPTTDTHDKTTTRQKCLFILSDGLWLLCSGQRCMPCRSVMIMYPLWARNVWVGALKMSLSHTHTTLPFLTHFIFCPVGKTQQHTHGQILNEIDYTHATNNFHAKLKKRHKYKMHK